MNRTTIFSFFFYHAVLPSQTCRIPDETKKILRPKINTPNFLAWVGVSGEKGKDGSEKGRELKERNFLSLLPLPPPPSKISSPLAP